MVLFLLFACAGDPVDAPAERGPCNPVEDGHCLLPFPSEFFLAEDATSPTGFRVDFATESLPVNIDLTEMEPTHWNVLDGFPRLGTLATLLPGATVTGAAGHQNIDRSLEADSPTLLIHAESGTRIPHWIEREARAAGTGRDLLLIRPVAPYAPGARYIVGIRGLVDGAGTPVDAPAGFATLRDGAPTDDPDLERQRAHHDDVIFPALETAGATRSELQHAWSFVTASEAATSTRAQLIRDDVLARTADAPIHSWTSIEAHDCSEEGVTIGRTLVAELTIPLYMEEDKPGSLLNRDAEGMPFAAGETQVDLTIRVPCSLLEEPHPAPLLQYGHGLLGHQSEVKDGYLGELANDNGWVLFATTWTGMSTLDAPHISLMMVNAPGDFSMVPERSIQGFAEAFVAAQWMTGPAVDDPELQVEGQALIDPETLHFYGNSQGAVLGGAYVALSPLVQRVVLGVGGTPFSLLLSRAEPFKAFFNILSAMYEDPADITLFTLLAQMPWDEGETAGYVEMMDKPVLLQGAIGDSSVSTLGLHVMARSFGAALTEEPSREIWGVPSLATPFTGNGLQEFDYGTLEPIESLPPETNSNHNGPRTSVSGQEQIAHFLETGQIIHTCDGACDPD
jgi:hypothetical protein